ncbi:MAG: Wzz/FepE/Etk N-terminal domain-containing protein [Betaproteobacteria bacterium]|nr:Wzz/FepE/Etk N-terminal domain-containing protein [Betaproteobacteria bacterium]
MHEALELLLLHIRGLWRRRWTILATAWIISVAGWIGVHFIPDRFEASARVYVDTQSLLGPLLHGMAFQPNADQETQMLTNTLISRPHLERVLAMTDLQLAAKTAAERDRILDQLQSQVKVTGTGRMNLYTISYQNPDPRLAKDVVRALLQIFLESGVGNERNNVHSAQRFIDQQLRDASDKLTGADEAIKAFKQQHLGLMPGNSLDYFSVLSDLSQKLDAAKLQLREATAQRDAIKSQLEGDAPSLVGSVSPTPASTSPVEGRIRALESRLDTLRLTYTNDYPDVVALRQTIAQLRARERREASSAGPVAGAAPNVAQDPYYQELGTQLADAEAAAASLQAKVQGYQARYDQLKAAEGKLPGIEEQYAELTRNYDVYKRNYDLLLAKREAADMSSRMQAQAGVVDFRVIDPPHVPLTPAWPNRPLFVSGVLLAAIAAGIAVAFLLNQIFKTVDDPVSLRECSDLPFLGAVALVQNEEFLQQKNSGLFRYALACLSLLVVYSVVLVFQSVPVPGLG